MNNLAQTIASLSGGGLIGGNVTTSGAGGLLTISGSATTSYAGVISGLGDLTLGSANTGTQTLSGADTYTGATTINGGDLNITGSLGATVVSVNGGGSLSGVGNGSSTGVIGNAANATGGTVTVTGGITALTRHDQPFARQCHRHVHHRRQQRRFVGNDADLGRAPRAARRP